MDFVKCAFERSMGYTCTEDKYHTSDFTGESYCCTKCQFASEDLEKEERLAKFKKAIRGMSYSELNNTAHNVCVDILSDDFDTRELAMQSLEAIMDEGGDMRRRT